MDKCFVIQPFDYGKFDSRFEDIFKPAIVSAGLEPYRVDQDQTVRIPIDEIERNIRESKICFAEITTDNPNVWYELGFAFACKKDIVMVCETGARPGKFPFDIQHRNIITYNSNSKSDYERLEESIKKRITAFLNTQTKVESLAETPIQDKKGLKGHEIAIMILLIQNQLTADDHMPISYLKSEMDKAGYTDVATSVGLRTLLRQNFVSTKYVEDYYSEGSYPVVQLTEYGEAWILENQNQLVFRKEGEKKEDKDSLDDDSLPF